MKLKSAESGLGGCWSDADRCSAEVVVFAQPDVHALKNSPDAQLSFKSQYP